MKRFIWFLLVIGAVAHPLSKTSIYLLFQANHAYIAAHICKKRAIPDSNCQGKCYLKKKLKKDAERQQQAPQAQKQVALDIIPATAGFRIKHVLYVMPRDKAPINYQLKVYSALTCSIFHPPQAMA